MKKIVLLSGLLFLFININAINFPVKYEAARTNGALDAQHQTQLKNQLNQLLQTAGMELQSDGPITLASSLEFQRVKQVEQKFEATGTLYLSFLNQLDGTERQHQMSLAGKGATKKLAIGAALSQISSQDKAMESLLKKLHSNIKKSYKKDCDKIIEFAQKSRQPNRAMLAAIPENASCYSKAQTIIEKQFVYQQDEMCLRRTETMRVALEKENYSEMLRQMNLVYPKAECFKDALAYFNQIEKAKLQGEDLKNFNELYKILNDATLLEEKQKAAMIAH